jgi:RNA polymerase sigma factor (sigma-70 family)
MDRYQESVVQAQAGDARAYNRLVIAFQDMAFAYAYARLGDFHLAQDVTQEAFIEGFRDIGQLRDPDAWPGWLRRIIFKQCDRAWRRPSLPTTSMEQASSMPDDNLLPDEIVAEEKARLALSEALQNLPFEERAITTLYYIREHRQKDIAVFLGFSTETVKNRLRTARQKLKGRLMNMAKKVIRAESPSKDDKSANIILMQNACKVGDLAVVTQLIERDVDLVNPGYAQPAPLKIAVREGHIELVEFLLENGALPEHIVHTTFNGFYPDEPGVLEIAEIRGFHEVADLVRQTFHVSHQIEPEGETLGEAVRSMNLHRIESLVTEKPDSIHSRDAEQNTALHWAARIWDQPGDPHSFEIIDYLIDHGADIHATNQFGFTPLHYSIWFGASWGQRNNWALTGYLLARGATLTISMAAAVGDVTCVKRMLEQDTSLANDREICGRHPVSTAAEFGHTEIVQMLLEHGADPNGAEPEVYNNRSYAMVAAALYDHYDIARMLLEHGSDPNAYPDSWASVCGIAQQKGHDRIATLVASYGGFADLSFYVWQQNLPVAAALLASDPNPEKANSLLSFAGSQDNPELAIAIIRLAIKNGAEPSKLDHWRMMRYAEDKSRLGALAYVFEQGANPNVCSNEGGPLLHTYAAKGYKKAVELALEAGADPHVRDGSLRGTALAWAARHGQAKIARLLLERGVKPNLPDDEPWQTPLFWARHRGHTDVVALLVQHGADQ